MKHKVVVEFDQPTYAALIAAWAAVVPSGFEEELPFYEFVRVAAQCGSVKLLEFAKQGCNKE